MAVPRYRWAAVDEFRDRTNALAELESWWASASRDPVNLYGRRRVGKSWLFRRLAHGKPAVVLVAERAATGPQLTRMAAQLADVLGVRPALDDVADLFEVLYDLGTGGKVLVVVDEFPYLLGTTKSEQSRTLTAIQAVMERKRDDSAIKLVLTGSTVSQMVDLQDEASPLHGRLRPLALRPMRFAEAALLLDDDDVIGTMSRYAVAGGMPKYLDAFAHGDLLETIARTVADPHSALFNEPRALLHAELREPAVYFSILSELSGKPQDAAAVAAALRIPAKELAPYLATLESLQLLARRKPVGAPAAARSTQWYCPDHFVRFWFRFIQPYQSELEAGADPAAHVELNVGPKLADHTAPVFEEVVTAWMRAQYPGATQAGGWWGNALDRWRASKERSSEEIDTVVLHGKAVTAVAEAKWTAKPMDVDVLTDLIDFKLPALAQAGLGVTTTQIVLASRRGFTPALQRRAATAPQVRLVAAQTLLADLIAAA